MSDRPENHASFQQREGRGGWLAWWPHRALPSSQTQGPPSPRWSVGSHHPHGHELCLGVAR